ncbi:hypothetical protein DXC92_26775 [Clostridiales bacterium TF09-2AC]|nr:hypothetical protein DXC92_26775 [Clostridiales bacterium TF09-2AC]
MRISEKVAGFICRDRHYGEDINNVAIRCFLDSFGCMLLGCTQRTPLSAINYVRKLSGKSQSTVYCRKPFKTDMENAAFVNAISAHDCDYDDMTIAGCGHPSIPVFPVILSMGEAMHKSGVEMLDAYITGMEVSMRMGYGLGVKNLNPAWNPTTVFGIFGATAAAARLLDLDMEHTCSALGIASCEAGGTKGNYGTGAKNITVGHLCMKGIRCAGLAKEGILSSYDVFESINGFVSCFTKKFDMDMVLGAFDCKESFLFTPGIIQKPYSTCRSNHNAIDGAIWMYDTPGFSFDKVDYVECYMDSAALRLDTYRIPENTEQAKFSTAYCIALSLIYGDMKTEYFLDEAGIDETAKNFINRIYIYEKNDFCSSSNFASYLKVYFKDGTYLDYMGENAKGERTKTLMQSEQYEKFSDCLSHLFNKKETQEIYNCLSRFWDCTDFNSVNDMILEYLADISRKEKR